MPTRIRKVGDGGNKRVYDDSKDSIVPDDWAFFFEPDVIPGKGITVAAICPGEEGPVITLDTIAYVLRPYGKGKVIEVETP